MNVQPNISSGSAEQLILMVFFCYQIATSAVLDLDLAEVYRPDTVKSVHAVCENCVLVS